MVILVSKDDDTPFLSTGGPGTLTAICSQAPNLVKCYAGDGNQSGLTFIHGWSDAPGTPVAPKIRDVRVVDVNCATDDDSAPYFLLTGECDVGALAVVDFGVTGDPRLSSSGRRQSCCDAKGAGMRPQRVRHGIPKQLRHREHVVRSRRNSRSCIRAGDLLDRLGDGVTRRSRPLRNVHRRRPPVRRDRRLWPGAVPQARHHGRSGVGRELTQPGHSQRPGRPSASTSRSRSAIRSSPHSSFATRALRGASTRRSTATRVSPSRTRSPTGCGTTYGLNYDNWDGDTNTPKTWADITCSGYGSGDLPPVAPTDPAPNCVAAKTGDVISFRHGLKERFETPLRAEQLAEGQPSSGP